MAKEVDGTEPLKFIVAPHIVQDLGLNLYTDLPRILVEYVANAYDADAPTVEINMNIDEIHEHRKLIKAQWEAAKQEAIMGKKPVPDLAEETMPDNVVIEIKDNGQGMSRADLQRKFLIAGRRRREEEEGELSYRTENGRILMGRKGLGKLAGFGVAQDITIISKTKGEKQATKIVLDYKSIINVRDSNAIPITEEALEDGGGILTSGTRVILSRLLYEPMKSRLDTVENRVADHFYQIDPKDFKIELNKRTIAPSKRNHVYAWPNPETPINALIPSSYKTEDGRTFEFSYRLRFLGPGEALDASDRGVRVYAHNRLAAAASLLGADTNMHGFRMTDYLDGVVSANFIDDQPQDYIATDRQSLRWESPLLQPMFDILSKAIKDACYNRQKKRDEEIQDEAKKDKFTMKEIAAAEFTKKEKTAALKIATAISSLYKKGVKDEAYKTTLKQILHGFGQGEILTTLSRLAKDTDPAFDRVIAEVTKLTAEELDGFFRYARGRIHGITALRKIVKSVDFKKPDNENKLHKLFNENPWLINPTFFEFLTSNQSEKSVFLELTKELKIGKYTDKKYKKTAKDETEPGGKNLRPDLVFLLGNEPINKLVIVELKSPNTPLYGEHYRQLQKYVRHAKKWLQRRNRTVDVQGYLIGSFAPIPSKADDVEWLDDRIEETGNQGECLVYDIGTLLEITELIHKDLLKRNKAKILSE